MQLKLFINRKNTMKKFSIFIIIFLIFKFVDAQNNTTVSEICKIFRTEFKTSNINSEYDKQTEVQSFNFNKMKPGERDTVQNLTYKLYYFKDTLKRISVYDTSLINRNWDFDILKISDDFIISSIFIFDNNSHNKGDYFHGFLFNDRKNNKSLLFNLSHEIDKSLYISRLIYDVRRYKKRDYEPEIESDCENFIFSIFKIDSNLFPVRRLNWNYQFLLSHSYFHYLNDKIIEELYIINQKDISPDPALPYTKLLGKHSLKELYQLLEYGYCYSFSVIFPLPYSEEDIKHMPIWANKKFNCYYLDRPESDEIDRLKLDDK